MFRRVGVFQILLFLVCALPLPVRAAKNDGFFEKLKEHEGQNSFWYEPNNSDTVIVFLHGIFSDSRECWLYKSPDNNPKNNQYWPEIVRYDSRFKDRPSIFMAGYNASVDGGKYDIKQAAKDVLQALTLNDVLKKKRIIFLAHSTGGVVARYMLYHNQPAFVNRPPVGLALFASPSEGSVWATTGKILSKLYGNRMAQQLEPGNPFLGQIDHNFRDLLNTQYDQPNNMIIVGAEAVEHHFILHNPLVPDGATVVPESSASRYFGSPNYVLHTDHFSIVKPYGMRAPSHEFFLSFYNRYQSIPTDQDRHHTMRECLISLYGPLTIEGKAGRQKTADIIQDFVGVGGNYPTQTQEGLGIWPVVCGDFRPSAPVTVYVHVSFDQSAGGNTVSARPVLIQDGKFGPWGQTFEHLSVGPTPFFSTAMTGNSSKDGRVITGIYVGIPDAKKFPWTISARPGSYIKITQQ